ncbi:MAG: hypothetical protein M3N91_14100 [Pseudomonadota bacterium]|nr:hypothetical protein [Pseudomonadota bacterium]
MPRITKRKKALIWLGNGQGSRKAGEEFADPPRVLKTCGTGSQMQPCTKKSTMPRAH